MSTRRIMLAAALALAACHDPVDQKAKARIFSPEDPPRFVTNATEDLGAEHLDQSAEHIKRVFTMSALEAAERLGPHEVKSKLEYHWKMGDKTVALDETHTLTLGSHGDFSARLDAGDALGESRQGMEMVRAQGHVYARSRFQKFRERNRDRGAANRYLDEVYDVLGTAYTLFDGRVALQPEGETEVAGRKAFKYKVLLAEKPPALEDNGPKLPALQGPRGGIDPHLARELDLDKKKDPKSLDGTLTVDAKTAVPLEADLTGVLQAPGEGAAATLKLVVEENVPKVSDTLVVAAPKEPLPDEGRPQGIAAALERFDLPRAATRSDAGEGSADTDEEGP